MQMLRLLTSRAVLALIVMLLAVGFAFSFPADIAFLMAIDLGAWMEAAVAVFVVAQVTKVRPVAAFVRARLIGRLRKSARRRRVTTGTPRQAASNDDGHAPVQCLAA